MRTMHKNKSRQRLYNAMMGTHEATGASGALAIGDIVFANIPVDGETVTIGGYVFEAQAGASEAAGTSAGTAADPHLFQSITNLATAGASLAAQVLAETATTGAWGFLYPDDSVGVDFTTDTLTLSFYPGAAGNNVVLAGSVGDETITQPVGGISSLGISTEHKYTLIDTTGSAANKEYYNLEDGSDTGDTVKVVIKAAAGSDTPTIVGKLSDAGTANVEALFATGEVGQWAEFMWTGVVWELLEEGQGTALTFTPAS